MALLGRDRRMKVWCRKFLFDENIVHLWSCGLVGAEYAGDSGRAWVGAGGGAVISLWQLKMVRGSVLMGVTRGLWDL